MSSPSRPAWCRRVLCLMPLVLGALSGCVTHIPTRPLAAQDTTRLQGASVVVSEYRDLPDFVAMTPVTGAMALVGLAMAIRDGNSLVRTHQVPDPAIAVRAALVQALTGERGMQEAGRVAAEGEPEPDQLAKSARGQARYLLDVRSLSWSHHYSIKAFGHYKVLYAAKARLIDTESGQVLAEAGCSYHTAVDDESTLPEYDELWRNGGAQLKRMLQSEAVQCARRLRVGLLALPDRPPGAEAVAGSSAIPTPAPAAAVASAPTPTAPPPGAMPVTLNRLPDGAPSNWMRPRNAQPLDAAALVGHSWRYPHPRDPQRYGDVVLQFEADRILARNGLSSAVGSWQVGQDVLCFTANAGWGTTCLAVVLDQGQRKVMTMAGRITPLEER